jgi:hypothetical protein
MRTSFPHLIGEVIDGVLYAQPLPGAPRARAASREGNEKLTAAPFAALEVDPALLWER